MAVVGSRVRGQSACSEGVYRSWHAGGGGCTILSVTMAAGQGLEQATVTRAHGLVAWHKVVADVEAMGECNGCL